jgi:transcriptional regulator with XRE-family HTH domain
MELISLDGMSPTSPTPLTLDAIARANIRRWIRSTGITQAMVADQIGRTQPWMSGYIKGSFDADLTTLQKMAKVFGHTLWHLLDIPPDPQEALLLGHYRALIEKDRQLAIDVLESWSRPRGDGRMR